MKAQELKIRARAQRFMVVVGHGGRPPRAALDATAGLTSGEAYTLWSLIIRRSLADAIAAARKHAPACSDPGCTHFTISFGHRNADGSPRLGPVDGALSCQVGSSRI